MHHANYVGIAQRSKLVQLCALVGWLLADRPLSQGQRLGGGTEVWTLVCLQKAERGPTERIAERS
eukprot:14050102-Alexandrium_andersonii.AAC.1